VIARKVPRSVLAGAVAAIVAWIVSHGRASPYDNYVLLAQAWLHGHAWIVWPGPYIDALPYHGRYYVIEAPFPAVVLLPFVALFGSANQTLVAVLFAGIAVGAAWAFAERHGLPADRTLWLCAFLFAGTDLLWCAMLGDVWFLAHVCAVACTLLALAELAGKRRGWLVGLYAAAAFESRFSLVLAVPIYAYLLATDRDRPFALAPGWKARIGGLIAVLLPVAVLWVLYNEARWGTWYDIGYTAWYHQDQVGMPTGSPFRLQYLPYQLWSYFIQAPVVVSHWPWLIPSLSGVALTWTSPALVLAFFARRPARDVMAWWAAAVLAAGPNFLYYVNGFAQFGMRHALDFEPFLFALMVLAARDRFGWWWTAMIAYSCAVGVWGCWYWNTFVRSSS
jgi:hypothetical protein